MIKTKNLEMERVSWIIQVGPVQSHESLKAETLSQLWAERDVMAGQRGTTLLALKIGGWGQPIKAGKGKGTDSLLEPSEMSAALPTP